MPLCDAACSRCRRRFGWDGPADARPPCPGCGHTPPAEELAADAREVMNFRDFLRRLGAHRRRVRAGETPPE